MLLTIFLLERFLPWSLLGGLMLSCLVLAESPLVLAQPSSAILDDTLELSQVLEDDFQYMQEETVVTPLQVEQPISEAPANIYVLTAEDIRQSGATNLSTLLRRVPGMEVMQTTGADFNVSARGNNQLFANKLLVLVDGRSIYLDAQGSVFWKLLPVTLPEIERIEVIKGPASSIYGFNAFDGVVNILTKTPGSMTRSLVQTGYGEFGTLTSSALHDGRFRNLGYRLSLGWDQNQQWRNREALAFRSYKFNVQTDYQLTPKGRVTFSGGLVDSNRFDGQLGDTTQLAGAPSQGYVTLGYKQSDFFLRTFWNRFRSVQDVRPFPTLAAIFQPTDIRGNPQSKNTTHTFNIVSQYTKELHTTLRVLAGANYRHNTFRSNFSDGFRRENRFGLYGQGEWTMFPELTAVAGMRYDLDTFINPTFSPRLAMIFKPWSSHTIRASWSIAYRPPTLFETHAQSQVQLTLPFGSATQSFRGTNRLKSEKIVSYEIAYQGWFLQHRLRIRTALFYNRLSNLINFVPPEFTPTEPVSAVNTGKADIYGSEAGVEVFATEWLRGFANVAYQNIDQNITGLIQRAGPHTKVSGGLRGSLPNGFNGEAVVHWIDATTLPLDDAFTTLGAFGVTEPNAKVGPYTLLNIRAGYRFWEERAEVALSVFNALNDRHREHPLGDTIGSRVMGWFTLRL